MPEVIASWLKLTNAPRIRGGRGLADVERHHHRRRPHREPDHHPGHEQHPVAGGQRRQQHADDEDRRGAEDGGAPADLVSDLSGEQGPDDGTDQQDAGQQLLLERGQAVEVFADEQQRPGDQPQCHSRTATRPRR